MKNRQNLKCGIIEFINSIDGYKVTEIFIDMEADRINRIYHSIIASVSVRYVSGYKKNLSEKLNSEIH